MSYNFKELEKRYNEDAAFNKMVNIFQALIKEYGFMPSEIREGLFFAQYIFEMNNVQSTIRTQEEWRRFNEANKLLQEGLLGIKSVKEFLGDER